MKVQTSSTTGESICYAATGPNLSGSAELRRSSQVLRQPHPRRNASPPWCKERASSGPAAPRKERFAALHRSTLEHRECVAGT